MERGAREALLERLRAYLDGAPDTPPEAEAPDLYTLLAELAAVKSEVKLEARQVKTALEQFSQVFDTLRQATQRLQEELDRQRERTAAERRDAEQALLLELVDLRDRLQAGQEQAARYRPSWLARRGGAARMVSSLAEGQAMTLRRLDQALGQRGVRPVDALQRPFDPHTMHAVDTGSDPTLPSGVVLSELRRGFLRDGRVLRAADVIVNKKDSES
jgi:molecular chaperone GrpE